MFILIQNMEHHIFSIILIVVIIMEYHIIKYHQAIYLNIQVKKTGTQRFTLDGQILGED